MQRRSPKIARFGVERRKRSGSSSPETNARTVSCRVTVAFSQSRALSRTAFVSGETLPDSGFPTSPIACLFFLSLLWFFTSARIQSSLLSSVTVAVRPMSSSAASRWLRPEVYPLFAAVGVAVGICGFQLVRNICINPEVRVSKENRAAGVLDNFAEGEKYSEHFLRKFVRNKTPEIMPSINSIFAGPNQN